MAKFRDSVVDPQSLVEAAVAHTQAHSSNSRPALGPALANQAQQGSSAGSPYVRGRPVEDAADTRSAVVDRSIGAILAELRNLNAEQVDEVLQHQRQNGVRFGDAAVALGLVSKDDVLFALSQQFHYPYAPEEKWHIRPNW